MKEKVHKHIYGTQPGDSPPFAIWPVKLKWNSYKQVSRYAQGQARQRQTLSAESTSLDLHHSHSAQQRARVHDTCRTAVSIASDHVQLNPSPDPYTLGSGTSDNYIKSASNCSWKWPLQKDSSESGKCVLCVVVSLCVLKHLLISVVLVEAVLSDVLDLYLSRGHTPVTEWIEATDEAKDDQPRDVSGIPNSVSEEGCVKRQPSSLHFQPSSRYSWRPNSRKVSDQLSKLQEEQDRMLFQESRFASRIPRWKGLSKTNITGKDEEPDIYLPVKCEPPQRSLMKPLPYELNCGDRLGGMYEHILVKPSFNESWKTQAALASLNIVTEDPSQRLNQSAAGVAGLSKTSLHEKQGTYHENQLPDSTFFGPLIDGRIYELSALKEDKKLSSIRQYPRSSSSSTFSSNSNIFGPFYSETVIASPQAMFHSSVDQLPASLSDHMHWRLRPCYILIFLGVVTIVGSLAPALWRSTRESDISGGFGLAQYILGVGVFAVGSMVAIHSRRCSCWRS